MEHRNHFTDSLYQSFALKHIETDFVDFCRKEIERGTGLPFYAHKDIIEVLRDLVCRKASLKDGLRGVVQFDASPAGRRRLFATLPEAVQKASEATRRFDVDDL